jgi:hypothetical protein
MKKIILTLIVVLFITTVWSQPRTDSVTRGIVTITKDDRIDLLGKKMAEYNEGLANKIHMEKGYRLMLLNTTDRNQALQMRSSLMQLYPEQNVYMTFQSPYIKLKFGDFLDKEEAEKMRKELNGSKVVPGNIYVVPEMVEVKPDKNKQNASVTDE